MKERILVTGGAGFLGSNLCERLVQQGPDVTCIDNFYTGHRANIDLHIISPRMATRLRTQCLDSLKTAPINIFHVQEDNKTIGYNRKLGYAFGEADFKSHADYDDIYNPKVFPHIIAAFQENPTASMVYTEETKFNRRRELPTPNNNYNKNTHLEKPSHVHGLIVYKTSVITTAPEDIWNFRLVDWAMTLWASLQGPIIKIPYQGRRWRQRSGQLSSTISVAECDQVRDWFSKLV